MEIRIRKRLLCLVRMIVCFAILFLMGACSHAEKAASCLMEITLSAHTLMALTPGFSMQVEGQTLQTQYPSFRGRKEQFPITGILRVDGKSYRFMGNDSLRIVPLSPMADDSCEWQAKYTYLYPGAGWERKEYDDSRWQNGTGAFGAEDCHYPFRTVWGGNAIYVRRHFNIEDKTALEGRKLYLRYICDDRMDAYCNGIHVCQTERLTPQPQCVRLSEEVITRLAEGDNVLAVYGRNDKDVALLDFGLYMDNSAYATADTATLKSMNVQTFQTQYVFQCGEVELMLDFVSPVISGKLREGGSSVGFITYQIKEEKEKQHDIELLFDVDMEWLFGKTKVVEERRDEKWQIVRADSLYIAAMTENAQYRYRDGHAVFSRKLSKGEDNHGALLLGYKEKKALQYDGEICLPVWNETRKRKMEDWLQTVADQYDVLKKECDEMDVFWNAQLSHKKKDGTDVRQMIPAFRNFVASHYFVKDADNRLLCFGDTLGNIREVYRIFPVLLFFGRTDWMKALLDPVLGYCADTHWKKRYPPYDLGLYPIANRQVAREDCGVEVAADMLMMMAAVVEAEKSFDYAESHWSALCRWAEYLKDFLPKEVSSGGLSEETGRSLKCIAGWEAYQKLVQLKKKYG